MAVLDDRIDQGFASCSGAGAGINLGFRIGRIKAVCTFFDIPALIAT